MVQLTRGREGTLKLTKTTGLQNVCKVLPIKTEMEFQTSWGWWEHVYWTKTCDPFRVSCLFFTDGIYAKVVIYSQMHAIESPLSLAHAGQHGHTHTHTEQLPSFPEDTGQQAWEIDERERLMECAHTHTEQSMVGIPPQVHSLLLTCCSGLKELSSSALRTHSGHC